MNVMIMENLFRNPLVLAQSQAGGAATRERQALHFKKRNDVLVEAGIVPELFHQIEKNVGRERLQFLPEQIDIVEDGEMLRVVAERI